jgi:hypothetical protein
LVAADHRWSAAGAAFWNPTGWCCGALGLLEPVDEHVDAGGESFVPVVEPDVLAEGDQGGEAVTGQ